MSLDFIAPRRLTAASVQACLRAGDPESGWSVINLLALDWIEPAGLVGLAMFAESQAEIGRSPRLIAPGDAQKARYLSRMHVGELIEELGGAHNLPTTNEWDRSGELLELQRFDGTDAAEELAKLVETQLAESPTAYAMHKAICEIGANVPDHSGRQHGYIAAVTTHQSRRVSFAVGDAGVGLLEPLQALDFTSHEGVIEALFSRGGISRTQEQGRGRGVFRTKELVTREGGEVFMASGRAGITAFPAGQTKHAAAIPIPGTLLQGSLRS